MSLILTLLFFVLLKYPILWVDPTEPVDKRDPEQTHTGDHPAPFGDRTSQVHSPYNRGTDQPIEQSLPSDPEKKIGEVRNP